MRWDRMEPRFGAGRLETVPSKAEMKRNPPPSAEATRDSARRARNKAYELHERYPHLFPAVPEWWKN